MESRIKKISLVNLFGFLNHEVSLNEDGVTFIHGPNGCGKTTFLKVIAAFYNWEPNVFFEVNFDKLIIQYSNGIEVTTDKHVENKIYDDETIEIPTLSFTLVDNDETKDTFEIKRNLKELKNHPIPYLHQVNSSTWIDFSEQEKLSYHEVLKKYGHQLPFDGGKKRPEWLHNLQSNGKLHFVQTQRLLRVSDSDITLRSRHEEVSHVIQLYSKELKQIISEKLTESAAVSQSKDRSFPERVLSLHLDEDRSEDVIRNDYKKTEDKIEKLMGAGVIEQEKNISLPDKNFEATEKKVLSLYLQDINEKLSIFDDLLLRIETFLNIISPKLRNKKFMVNRQNGFLIETTHGTKSSLQPSELSSGEQHEIVLFYELIFKTRDNSFFLIDEPEISLHVDWQRQFLSDISKIAKLGKHSFIIATHSPQIIGSRRDLAVALDGGILSE
ncbi:MAG: AAA family ATPase [Pseudomonadota bacterium]